MIEPAWSTGPGQPAEQPGSTPAYWIIWLIASGHTPASAEQWAAEIPSWHTAPAEGITAFATTNASLWSEISKADPAPWTLRLATAADVWHTHRSGAEG